MLAESMQSMDVDVADGVRLRVRHRPGTAGPPFLLVHGLSSNARLWDAVARSLAEAGHPVFAVDLRSHGESDAPPDGYDTGTAAADLAALWSRLGLPPAVVAGQSWGGNVVVRLAARHPELVGALALVDGGWIDLSATFDTWEQCETALRPPDVDSLRAAELRDILTSSHPDWSAEAIAATMANLREAPDGTLRRRLAVPDHMRIVRSMWDDPPWTDFPGITAPVLLLPAIPAAASAGDRKSELVVKAAGALPRARIREYVGADHDLHAQHPGEVAADLLALAKEV
jgi:pimeloyl-ACP methyl ester carboxylesterase